MKVLVTGSKGFIGQNLIKILQSNPQIDLIMEYGRNDNFDILKEFCQKADAVFHLAAVLRPENPSGFDDNVDLTSRLLNYLLDASNKCPIMFASSIQADLDNPYGGCKRVEEKKFFEYGRNNNSNVYIFRFPNLFGIMSRPNYTSVISTFCYNTVKGLPIIVNNPAAELKFAFIERVLAEVTMVVLQNESMKQGETIKINDYYPVGLGELAYYMQTLKSGVDPKIKRDDNFYADLSKTYEWYSENYAIYDC